MMLDFKHLVVVDHSRGEKLLYLDFTSLYPSVNAGVHGEEYPVGHPDIFLSDDIVANLGNVTEGLLREMQRVPESRRAQAMKQLNFVGEHVETTTPWIIDRLLTDTRQGNDITWLTTGRMLSRGIAMLFGQKRDVISRYQSHRGGA